MTFCKIGKTLLKNAFRRKNPKQKLPGAGAEDLRGSINVDSDRCTLCGECEERCVSRAIIVSADEETWEINRMQCVLCGECVDICPEGCLDISGDIIGAEFTSVTDVFNIGEEADAEAENEEDDNRKAGSPYV